MNLIYYLDLYCTNDFENNSRSPSRASTRRLAFSICPGRRSAVARSKASPPTSCPSPPPEAQVAVAAEATASSPRRRHPNRASPPRRTTTPTQSRSAASPRARSSGPPPAVGGRPQRGELHSIILAGFSFSIECHNGRRKWGILTPPPPPPPPPRRAAVASKIHIGA